MGNLEPSERAMAAMRSSAIKRRLVAPLAISCGSMISSTAANSTAKVVAMALWKGFRGRRPKRSENFMRPPPKARGRAGLGHLRPKGECLRERSEEHTSELQSLMRISYAVFCLKKKTIYENHNSMRNQHSELG